ncbi:SAP domain-containing ribonucleoprotein [Acipenser ruthenus]|uniref:SAP domain-containing ribonucleoprotein n=1 Tax=Acipenser ruthenus TaxID=7906 RepID=A0A662YL76_ACIRT|nr:SAP domain-containing ribonucleoprotein [Acipenser ruthenus]
MQAGAVILVLSFKCCRWIGLQRFSQVEEDEKLKKRKERFGILTSAAGATDDIEEEEVKVVVEEPAEPEKVSVAEKEEGGAADKKVVKIASTTSPDEKLQQRAQRFNVPPTGESKKAARAARFGLPAAPEKGQTGAEVHAVITCGSGGEGLCRALKRRSLTSSQISGNIRGRAVLIRHRLGVLQEGRAKIPPKEKRRLVGVKARTCY